MAIEQGNNQVPEENSAVADNPNPKITTNWCPVAGEPSHLWRKLWARLLISKKRTPPEQAPREDTLTGSAEEDSSHASE